MTDGLARIWGRVKARAKERDYGYSALGFLGAISIVGFIGHLIDWFTHRRIIDLEWAGGFVALAGIILLLAPNRLFLVLASLAGVLAFGVLGAITQRTLLGLWIMVPCAVAAYLLIRWKGKNFK
jgi:hypothetical protein